MLVMLLGSTTVAAADPADFRFGAGATMVGQHSNLATNVSQVPGPGLFLDWTKTPSPHFAIGLHFGWGSSFNRADLFGAEEKTFQQLIEAHMLLEGRSGRVAFGASFGVDVLDARGSYSDGNGDPDHTDEAFGTRVHLVIDVGSIDEGTFAVTGSASLFSLLHASGACGGELSCADQATALSIGVAFRPR